MNARFGLGLVLVFAGACRRPVETGSEPTAAPAPSASVAPRLTTSNEFEAAGVRVKTGSLPAIGVGGVWGFTDVAPDLGRTRLEIEVAKRGAPLAELLPSGGLLVVNGGYFEADFRPSTWLKNAGVELAPKSDTSKGGLLALRDGAVYIGPFAQLGFEPELAVQSFPLIVEPDRVSGIHRDDGRRAARTVACLVERQLHFIVVSAPRGEGPTLFETADLLRAAPPLGFGCRVALNLDGGPSTGVWFGPAISSKPRPPLANVAYAIAVLPR